MTATPALNSLVVSWVDIYDTYGSADGYKVQWKSGSQSYDAARQATVGASKSHTIPGLTGGTYYSVRVIATRTNAPDGLPSHEAGGTPYLYPAPGVPGSATATPAARSLNVSWTAAANADGYKVQWKSGSQTYSTSTRQATASGTSHTITGLTGGTAYTVRVIATRTNAPDGAASSEATGTPQHPAPLGRFLNVTATPALNSLVVSWVATHDTYGSADGYKVQWKSGSQSYDAARQATVGASKSHTITGLTGGTSYDVRVIPTRTNAPDGWPSGDVAGTPYLYPAPGVPGSVTATPSMGSLVVSWSAATNADGYKVQWKSGSQSYDAARQATATGTSRTIPGLRAGTAYTVRVIATRTNAPDGAASSEATGTPLAPAVPSGVTATPAVGSLVVSWGAVANANGYKVQWKSGSQEYDTSTRQATASGTSHTITGLTGGTSYDVRVIATFTSSLDSAPSSSTSGRPYLYPAPGVPGSVTAAPPVRGYAGAAEILEVLWSAATNADGYKVQWKSGSQAYDTSTRQATATGTSHTITGLTAGTAYTVRVIATRTNAPDGAPSSEAFGAPFLHPAPGVPGSVTATPAVRGLVVSWSAATNADGYKVQWKSGGQSSYAAARQATTTGTSHTITGLTAGTEYTVRVIATRTNAPEGLSSEDVTGRPSRLPAPGVPGSVTVAPAGLTSLDVSWTAAANAEWYWVEWKSGSQAYDTSPRLGGGLGNRRPKGPHQRDGLHHPRPDRGHGLYGAGHRRPHGRPRGSLLGSDRDTISPSGAGPAGQRDGDAGGGEPRSLLGRRGQRQRLQGAVEVRGAGVQHLRPAGDDHRHKLYHHRPDRGHPLGPGGLLRAGDRHPHERPRQRACI